MISTGIPELDQRLGGLVESRYYLLTGTPGGGKTSAAVHFIAEGLKNGETCIILTQENPDDLFAQAEFIGFDFQEAAARETLILIQYRLDFSNNYARVADPRKVARELIDLLEGAKPTRMVVDSILPFVQAGGLAHGAVSALLHVLEEINPTTYFTVPGDLGDSFYARLYDPLVSSTAGVFHFEMYHGEIRQITIRKIRQAPNSTEPLRFVIRAGVGIVEYTDASVAEIPDEARTRIALINTGGRVGGELFTSLDMAYDLKTYASLDDAAEVRDQPHGAVIVAFDPLEDDDTFNFVHNLRRAGNGVPVILVTKSEGLRASTRARGLRAGADEFVTLDASPQEFLGKVEAARARGARNAAERLRREVLLLQPRDAEGKAMPVDEPELVRALTQHMGNSTHPFFAIVRVYPEPGSEQAVWQTLANQLRLADGDLIARGADGTLILYLHDVSRKHVLELMTRVFEADPRVPNPRKIDIHHYPADAARINNWLQTRDSKPLLRAHA